MSTNTTDPMTYVPGGKAIDREWYPNHGPVTGLAWGVEMVRQNCLSSAANMDKLAAKYQGKSEYGVGLCEGQAEAFRTAAEDLIRYAWWKP